MDESDLEIITILVQFALDAKPESLPKALWASQNRLSILRDKLHNMQRAASA